MGQLLCCHRIDQSSELRVHSVSPFEPLTIVPTQIEPFAGSRRIHTMGFIRIGGLPDPDYALVERFQCPTCPRAIPISYTLGEVLPPAQLEKARRKIEDSCPNHPGVEMLGPDF